MGRYCVITRDHNEFIIIEKKRLCYLNEKNTLESLNNDFDTGKYDGSFHLMHGEYVQSGLQIVDSDDEIAALKERNPGKGKRVRVFKSAPFSPGTPISSKENVKHITEQMKKKSYLKNPVAHTSTTKNNGLPRTSANEFKRKKSVVHNSGELFRPFMPPTDNQDNDDNVSSPHNRLSDSENDDRAEDIEEDGIESEGEKSEIEESNHTDDKSADESEDTSRRVLSNVTNRTSRPESEVEKAPKQIQSKSHPSVPWRRKVENTLTSIQKDVQKFSRAHNSGRLHEPSTDPENETISTDYPQVEEKIEIVDDVEITTINGVRFDPEQYASVLMASTMKLRAGRVMNVMWTIDDIKKLCVSELKTSENVSKVTVRDLSKIKAICRHLQKKHRIVVTPGSTDDINKHIKSWVSNKLKEKRRVRAAARPVQQ